MLFVCFRLFTGFPSYAEWKYQNSCFDLQVFSSSLSISTPPSLIFLTMPHLHPLLWRKHTLPLVDHSMWNVLLTDFVLASSLTSCEASYLKFQSLFQTFTSSIPTLLFSPLHLYLDLLTTHEIFCLFIEFMLCPTRMSVLDMQVFLSYFTAGDVVHN